MAHGALFSTLACPCWRLEAAAKICATLGAFVVYIGAYGWLACVLGIVAASLGCCVCCECCRAKLDESERMRQVGGNPMAVVVGKAG